MNDAEETALQECISMPISNYAQEEFKADLRNKSAGTTVIIEEKTRCYQGNGSVEAHTLCWSVVMSYGPFEKSGNSTMLKYATIHLLC